MFPLAINWPRRLDMKTVYWYFRKINRCSSALSSRAPLPCDHCPSNSPCHYEPQYASYVRHWCQGAHEGVLHHFGSDGWVRRGQSRRGSSQYCWWPGPAGVHGNHEQPEEVDPGGRLESIPQPCRIRRDFNLLLHVCCYSTTSWVGRKGAVLHLTASTVRDTGTWSSSSSSSSFCVLFIHIQIQPSLEKQAWSCKPEKHVCLFWELKLKITWWDSHSSVTPWWLLLTEKLRRSGVALVTGAPV